MTFKTSWSLLGNLYFSSIKKLESLDNDGGGKKHCWRFISSVDLKDSVIFRSGDCGGHIDVIVDCQIQSVLDDASCVNNSFSVLEQDITIWEQHFYQRMDLSSSNIDTIPGSSVTFHCNNRLHRIAQHDGPSSHSMFNSWQQKVLVICLWWSSSDVNSS